MMKLLTTLSFIASICAIGTAAGNTQTTPASESEPLAETSYVQDAIDAAQDPLQMGAMPFVGGQNSARHHQEKGQLWKRMDRKYGKWGTSHPRYRLLEALFGFTKYRELNMAELDRWRGLYENIGKKQKRVSM